MFKTDNLWAKDVVYANYIFIDNSSSVVTNHATGVQMVGAMDAVGIGPNPVETFLFWTRDKQSGYYISHPEIKLTGTDVASYPYCLPSKNIFGFIHRGSGLKSILL